MNNFYTLRSLIGELRYKISGKDVSKVWSHRKDQIDLCFQPEEDGKLTFSASSPGTALFWDPRPGIPKRNAVSFFPEIHGKTADRFELVSPEDRLIRMTFIDSFYELLFMPFSSRPNLFLVKGGVIRGAFKNPAGHTGRQVPEGWQPEKPSGPELQEIPPPPPGTSLKNRIIAIDKKFPRALIPDLADTCKLDQLDHKDLIKQITEFRRFLNKPQKFFITDDGRLSLLPSRYLSRRPLKTFDSVNEAVRTLFLMQNRRSRVLPQKNDLLKRLGKRFDTLEIQRKHLDSAPDQLKKADTFEYYGHLLMSSPDANTPAGTDEISIADWSDDGSLRTIPVKKGKTPVEQAQAYYDKAARIRREVATTDIRKRQLDTQKEEINRLLAELQTVEHPSEIERWMKRNRKIMQQYGITPSGSKPAGTRPYRLIPLGDHEVWIGKSAAGNDELLSLSHKEDIWMHVRGAGGSHVILRNKGQTGWPEPTLVTKAASWAAAYSKLSGSSMVPVMIAKRKHVRKPKGGEPGQVVVNNERVELVTPRKPEIPDS